MSSIAVNFGEDMRITGGQAQPACEFDIYTWRDVPRPRRFGVFPRKPERVRESLWSSANGRPSRVVTEGEPLLIEVTSVGAFSEA